jgi:hypothetical protein
MAKAEWLAVARMRPLHAGYRVKWRFSHTRNIAFRAMRDGHSQVAILEAWKSAIARSHEDACDHDLRHRPDPDQPHPEREPSAAVVYAWRVLRADKRTPAERWREIFAQERPARDATAARPGPQRPIRRCRPSTRSGCATSAPAPQLPSTNQPMKNIENPPREEKTEYQRTIESYLKSRGKTMADLLAMSREEQGIFVQAAFHRAKRGFDKI